VDQAGTTVSASDFRKRMSSGFTLETFYTWAKHDGQMRLNSSFVSDVQTGRGAGSLGSYGQTDSFVGIPRSSPIR